VDVLTKFILTVALIVGATGAGYLARRFRPRWENASQAIMTAVAVFGYPSVGFLSIWQIAPDPEELVLPGLAAAQLLIMAALGLALGRLITQVRAERGLFAIASAMGNWGFTMGGFVIYILFGPAGLGRAAIYALMFTPCLVLVTYPIARHFTAQTGTSLGRLMLRSILDFRSVGLATSIVALTISLAGVRPWPGIGEYHIIDVLMFLVMPLAYFSIGARLHFSGIAPLRKMLAALAGMRFVVSLLVGLGLLQLMSLTPWALEGLTRKVYLMQSVVPTAVSMVAVANMFGLKPREGSVLFVINSLLYLVIVLPIVLWVFGG